MCVVSAFLNADKLPQHLILYSIQYLTGSQCKSFITGITWSQRGVNMSCSENRILYSLRTCLYLLICRVTTEGVTHPARCHPAAPDGKSKDANSSTRWRSSADVTTKTDGATRSHVYASSFCSRTTASFSKCVRKCPQLL